MRNQKTKIPKRPKRFKSGEGREREGVEKKSTTFVLNEDYIKPKNLKLSYTFHIIFAHLSFLRQINKERERISNHH